MHYLYFFLKSLALALWFLASNSQAYSHQNLPDYILAQAVSSDIVFDEEFDYVRLGTASNLLQKEETLLKKQTLTRRSNAKVVDQVIVNKAAHQMILMKNGKEVHRFWIALSDKPVGHKQFEGDKKTPEGTYVLDYIKQKSYYYKAFHISYPNAKDIEFARKHGRRPGGMIMIHGQPPSKSEYHETVQRTNWTNGCIALLNPDIDLFLSLVEVGTPITINP